MAKGVSSKTHSQKELDNYANQHNPNNKAYKAKDGNLSYIYQCYGQLRTGTPESRRKKGLEVDGICDNSSFMEWKSEVQADFIFKKLLNNKEAIYREAMSMLNDVAEVKAPERNDKEKLE